MRFALAVFVISASGFGAARAQTVSEVDPEIFSQLRYRHIGPVGNRVSAVVGVPGDPNIYYFGSASGGVFKTTDGGVHWEPPMMIGTPGF